MIRTSYDQAARYVPSIWTHNSSDCFHLAFHFLL